MSAFSSAPSAVLKQHLVRWDRKGFVWGSDKSSDPPLLFTEAVRSWTKQLILPDSKTSTSKQIVVFNFL